MRDLERLQDVVEYRVSPGQLRLIFLGVLAVTCAIFAVGVSVGKRLEPGNLAVTMDPLSQLEQATQSESSPAENAEEEEAPALTYHNELTEHQESGDRRDPAASTPENETEGPSSAETTNPAATPSAQASAPPSRSSDERVQTEAARPEQPSPGESSVFTLQVASFETREEAQDFISDLRTRGHPVFLVRTSTPERGTWYRIRVGPFQNRRQATQYQSRFERIERLPTFLVQRRRS